MKNHILKAEVSPQIKFLLSEIAKKNKRSLKKQVEYIIEEHVRQDQEKVSPSVFYKGVPEDGSKAVSYTHLRAHET